MATGGARVHVAAGEDRRVWEERWSKRAERQQLSTGAVVSHRVTAHF